MAPQPDCAAGIGAPHIRQRLFWVADALSARRSERRTVAGNGQIASGGPTGGLGDAERDALEPRWLAEQPREGAAAAPARAPTELGRPSYAGFWSARDLIPCLDGKARRVESGVQPLAYGVPSRVGRLRAYGNAIVPQLAAEFVMACM